MIEPQAGPKGDPLPDHVRLVDGPTRNACRFSICTLLKREDSYRRFLDSASANGFSAANAEFVAVDNRADNTFDGYQAIRRFVTECRGEYVLFCHDDIEFVDDGAEQLLSLLADLDRLAPDWCIAGVAGGVYHGGRGWGAEKVIVHLSDVFGARQKSQVDFPCRVESVDECFFVMKRDRVILPSLDLEGFHFFGSDICLQAELVGGSSHVIAFHLMHHGEARRGPSFDAGREALRQKYKHLFPTRVYRATTGVIRMRGTLLARIDAWYLEATYSIRQHATNTWLKLRRNLWRTQ